MSRIGKLLAALVFLFFGMGAAPLLAVGEDSDVWVSFGSYNGAIDTVTARKIEDYLARNRYIREDHGFITNVIRTNTSEGQYDLSIYVYPKSYSQRVYEDIVAMVPRICVRGPVLVMYDDPRYSFFGSMMRSMDYVFMCEWPKDRE
jgi:hypothetical protein